MFIGLVHYTVIQKFNLKKPALKSKKKVYIATVFEFPNQKLFIDTYKFCIQKCNCLLPSEAKSNSNKDTILL